MPNRLSVEILPGELAQIVESVFAAMLSLEAGVCTEPWSPSPDRMISSVHLSGDWNGALVLECSHGQACRFAGRFLSMDPPSAVDDVVRDVLGELANMIGGNMKCLMTPGIHLSMPSVVSGSDYAVRVCGAEVLTRIAFRCAEGLFCISVLGIQSEPHNLS